jgi:pimeloyl-ACP methyl ester carboxylesterase
VVGRRLARVILTVLAAAFLLWAGLGNPHRVAAPHHREWVEAGGIRWRALRAGHGDTTLVLLHGFGESLLAWRSLVDRFTSHYRVLAVDLPGFGLSDKPAGRYDFATYQGWTSDLLRQQTTGPVVIVGHSMGGELAAGLALAHPERVVALVLIAPAGGGISPLLSDSGGIASPATQWVASALPQVFPAHDTTWLRESPADLAYQPSADSAAANALRQVLAQFDFAAIGARFRELRQPVLLIWGRQDPTIPFEIGDRIAGWLPCRRFVPLLALHRPHQTVPDTVASEMSAFLRRPACGTPSRPPTAAPHAG